MWFTILSCLATAAIGWIGVHGGVPLYGESVTGGAIRPDNYHISGAPLVQQPIVRLDDGTGEALGSGIPVTASVEHAALTGTITVKSDEYGEVAFTNLALSGSDGSYALTFSAPGVTGVRSGAITLATASADQRQLVITTQPSNSAQGGVAFAQQPGQAARLAGRGGLGLSRNARAHGGIW